MMIRDIYYVPDGVGPEDFDPEICEASTPGAVWANMFEIEDLLEEVFQEQDVKASSGCVCDCEKNYGKGCLNPKAYLSGGCK